ncbi:hypothetical protein, conserved [Babesia bigemina]|uniref:Uncharacterized protein n=1 Tax=Babesia bigemina TaxID=5866 RepID=A0A061D4W5_BABBI|nr:hypothetical protein, conserved [Babesia bigemina]CDR95608.1 hypothetical protein, conserved [Babesia bigemina]|eukprot:XP_012767794.1 hypothetical protein, conserved [Babesia bigemina]
MGVLAPLLMIAMAGTACGRRDNSLTSVLVRYIAERSAYKKGDQEYARITQAPMVKMHLRKVFLPSTMHAAMKDDMAEKLVERKETQNSHQSHRKSGAGEVDRDNEFARKEITESLGAVDELERLAGEPVNKMVAHNFHEQEFKATFAGAHQRPQNVAGIMQQSTGLSDYAVLPARPVNEAPQPYTLLERRKRKSSELVDQDAERLHVPLFAERGDERVATA